MFSVSLNNESGANRTFELPVDIISQSKCTLYTRILKENNIHKHIYIHTYIHIYHTYDLRLNKDIAATR